MAVGHRVDGGDDIAVACDGGSRCGLGTAGAKSAVDRHDDGSTTLVDSKSQRVDSGEVMASATRTSTETDAVGGGLAAASDERMVMTAGRERGRIIVRVDECRGATWRTVGDAGTAQS